MNKRVVVYFSVSETTHEVATKLAKVVDADLARIYPQEEYTEEDLDWNNPESRSSTEMSKPLSRPKMKALDINIENYDTIFLGFPIWWYQAPRIIETFLESCELSGKVIIPFATSGGSKMGRTVARLVQAALGAVILPGSILSKEDDLYILQKWAEKQLSYINLHKALSNAYHTMYERKYDVVYQIGNYMETTDIMYLTTFNDVREQLSKFDIQKVMCYMLEVFHGNWQEKAEISGNVEELKLIKEAMDTMMKSGYSGNMKFAEFLYVKDPAYIFNIDGLRERIMKYSTKEYLTALTKDFCIKNFDIPMDLKQ